MRFVPRIVTRPNVFRITFIISTFNQARRNRTSVIISKFCGDDMPARSLLWFITAFKQALHVGAVLIKDLTIVCLWKWRLAEPPHIFYSVFNALPAHRNPLRRRWELCWIVPKTLLRQMKSQFFAQH